MKKKHKYVGKKIIIIIVVIVVILKVYDLYTYYKYKKLYNRVGTITNISYGMNGDYDIDLEAPKSIISISPSNNVQIRDSTGKRINISNLNIGEQIIFYYESNSGCTTLEPEFTARFYKVKLIKLTKDIDK